MLAVHDARALRRAVAAADLKALTRVPGIGRKGAQRIVLELKDQLGTPDAAPSLAALTRRPAGAPGATRCIAALVGLGSAAAEDADEALAERRAGRPTTPTCGAGRWRCRAPSAA